MKNFFHNHKGSLVIALLLAKFSMGLFTMTDDAAIVDEIAHIPAGYSYLAYNDYRLNPEHPPLLKDISGFPLQFLNVKFPQDHISWTEDVNGQWESGWHFLYHYGNDADLIIFMARLPLLLLSLLFGLCIYLFSKKFFGWQTGLLGLFFYTFSPNFLAHSHFVTTDMGIAFFVFLSLSTFALFLKEPSKKTLAWSTLALFGAHAAKFSSVLLIPFYLLLILLIILAASKAPNIFKFENKFKSLRAKKWIGFGSAYVLMMIVSVLLIWAFYIPHTFNFSADKQAELIQISLASQNDFVRGTLVKMTESRILQPLAQYFLGVAMVFTRVSGGNTTYFLGEVSNQSFKLYFPVSYLLKTPLSFLLLFFLSLLLLAKNFFKLHINKYWAAVKSLILKNPVTLIFFIYAVYYAGISIAGNLNLGIRHLFPILPLVFILVSKKTLDFFTSFKTRAHKTIAVSILGALVALFGLSSVSSFPHFLAYHNELIGGGSNAWKYFTDSNVDWGQDLKRFASWMDEHPEIPFIRLDYFGGGEPKYYFCARKLDDTGNLIKSSSGYACENSRYQEWHVQNGQEIGWYAISVTFLQNAKYYAERFGQPDYDWLRVQEPYAKIGNSIFVYKVTSVK